MLLAPMQGAMDRRIARQYSGDP